MNSKNALKSKRKGIKEEINGLEPEGLLHLETLVRILKVFVLVAVGVVKKLLRFGSKDNIRILMIPL